MKKRLTICIIAIALVLTLSGCSERNSESLNRPYIVEHVLTWLGFSEQNTESVDRPYFVELAEKARTADEVYDILKEYNSQECQIALAGCKNVIVQEALLDYEGLTTEALIWICYNPNPNFAIDSPVLREMFAKPILAADLTTDQQMEIVKANNQPSHYGILCREDITYESLIYILNYNKRRFSDMNLHYYKISDLIYSHVLKIPLTNAEKKVLLEQKMPVITKALKERQKLEIEALLAD